MISAIHLRPPAGLASFEADAQVVLRALGVRPGFVRGELGRAVDDGQDWLLLTEWESVGAYRRGMGGYDVKMVATALMAYAVDQPSAYESLMRLGADGSTETAASDRSPSPISSTGAC